MKRNTTDKWNDSDPNDFENLNELLDTVNMLKETTRHF